MADIQGSVGRDGDVSAYHREHLTPARPHRVFVRLSDEERRLITEAARAARLTPAGYTAKAAVAAASSGILPAAGLVDGLRELQRELFACRRAVAMLGVNVSQVAAAYNSTGVLPEWVGEAVRLCAGAVARLDEVTARVDRRLR